MTATTISLARAAAWLAAAAFAAEILSARLTCAADPAEATTASVAQDVALAGNSEAKPFPYPLALKGPKPAPVTAPS